MRNKSRTGFGRVFRSISLLLFMSLILGSCHSLFRPGSMEVGEQSGGGLRYYKWHYESKDDHGIHQLQDQESSSEEEASSQDE